MTLITAVVHNYSNNGKYVLSFNTLPSTTQRMKHYLASGVSAITSSYFSQMGTVNLLFVHPLVSACQKAQTNLFFWSHKSDIFQSGHGFRQFLASMRCRRLPKTFLVKSTILHRPIMETPEHAWLCLPFPLLLRCSSWGLFGEIFLLRAVDKDFFMALLKRKGGMNSFGSVLHTASTPTHVLAVMTLSALSREHHNLTRLVACWTARLELELCWH